MTNPNPVAPKTDTLATQIPDDWKATHAHAKADPDGWMRFTGAETMGLIERIGLAESTLAAERALLAAMIEDRDLWKGEHDGDCPNKAALESERASRLQADTEQFNAGWINCRDYSAGQLREVASRLEQAYPDHSPQADTAYTIHKCADAIAESKPSVSPEQAEETK